MEWILKSGDRKQTKKMTICRFVDNNDCGIKCGKDTIINQFINQKNCIMFSVEFWLDLLNERQLIEQTEKFKSTADGMYNYYGRFFSREYIMEQLRKNQRILNAEFHYIEADK